MILYQPLYIDSRTDRNSATLIRPIAMRKGFESLGYKVFVVNGSTKERRKFIKKLFKEEKIDFMYIESGNIPFALSNKNHFPIDFLSDFYNILKAKKKVKVGMFYRDVFWNYPHYKKEIGFFKYVILKPLFYYEYKMLKKILDVVFVPNIAFSLFLPKASGRANFSELPPGCDLSIGIKYKYDSCFKILYSGNLSLNEYMILGLLKVLSNTNTNISLTINTNKKAYDSFNNAFPILSELEMKNKVKCIFSSYFDSASISDNYSVAIIYNNIPSEIRKIFMPVKLFHYISMGLPIIAEKESGYGDYIENNDIGWTYSNDEDLLLLINRLSNSEIEVSKKARNVFDLREKNTWEDRAKYVEYNLK